MSGMAQPERRLEALARLSDYPRTLRPAVRLRGRRLPSPTDRGWTGYPRCTSDVLHLSRQLVLETSRRYGRRCVRAVLRGPQETRRELPVLSSSAQCEGSQRERSRSRRAILHRGARIRCSSRDLWRARLRAASRYTWDKVLAFEA